MIHNILSFSGGKDSTAMYLLAVERGRKFRAVFADTGHEHDEVYRHVAYLPGASGGPPIETVRADLTGRFERKRETIRTKWAAEGIDPARIARALELCRPSGNVFLDLCLLRGGFPSSKRRYCTGDLKIKPIRDQVYRPIWLSGNAVVSWQGVRADESFARRLLPVRQQLMDEDGLIWAYRPLIRWTLNDVWAIHKRHGIRRNPLYDQGLKRVGCFPCIMGRKSELRIIAERFPEAIDKLREWERIVGGASKTGAATWFPANRLGWAGDPATIGDFGIDTAADWAKTTYGGKQYDLLTINEREVVDAGSSCDEWGACEF